MPRGRRQAARRPSPRAPQVSLSAQQPVVTASLLLLLLPLLLTSCTVTIVADVSPVQARIIFIKFYLIYFFSFLFGPLGLIFDFNFCRSVFCPVLLFFVLSFVSFLSYFSFFSLSLLLLCFEEIFNGLNQSIDESISIVLSLS
jgi:hypothetical protein